MNNDENNELKGVPVETEGAELANNSAEANTPEVTSESAEVVNDENQTGGVDPVVETEDGEEPAGDAGETSEGAEAEDPFKGKVLFGSQIAYSRPQIVEGTSRTFIMCDNGNTFLFSTEELESAMNKGDLQ